MTGSGENTDTSVARKRDILIPFSIVFLLAYIITEKSPFLFLAFGVLAIFNFLPPLADKLGGILEVLLLSVGRVVSSVLLTSIFLFLLTPLSFIYKMNDNLRLKKKPGSLFHERQKEFSADDFRKMW